MTTNNFHHLVTGVICFFEKGKYVYRATFDHGCNEVIRRSTRKYEGAVIYKRVVNTASKNIGRHFTFFNGNAKINNNWVCNFSTHDELINDDPQVIEIKFI